MSAIKNKIEEATKKRVLHIVPYFNDGSKIYAVYFSDGDDADYVCNGGDICRI